MSTMSSTSRVTSCAFEKFRHFTSMNCLIVAFFIVLNVSICLHVWLNWKSVKHDHSNFKTDDQEFIPTNEWKPLKKDQPIPKGLHVRINLQTGEREAKLLEIEKKDVVGEEYPLIPLDEGETNVGIEDADKLKYEVLKESLKNIEHGRSKLEDGEHADPKKKFRTYEQLKEELRDVNINIKTDAEVLDDLFKVFKDKYKNTGQVCSAEDPELVTILKNLENLLHQVDNAEEFCKRNGIVEIILPCLSSNSTSMRTVSARVLGAAAQNNPKVQIDALRAGVITPLLKTVALTKNYEARASSIFALSCMIRSFPFAEVKLIEEGGLDVLLSLFEETSADALKLQMKVISLFYDLTVEKEDAEETVKEEKLLHNTADNEMLLKEMQQMQERLKQYKEVDLKTKLIERGWCSKLGQVLSSTVRDTNFAHVPDVREDAVNHDVIEKVSRGMLSFAVECRQQFLHEKGLVQVLKNLLMYYEKLITNDELYKDMHLILRELNTKLNLS